MSTLRIVMRAIGAGRPGCRYKVGAPLFPPLASPAIDIALHSQIPACSRNVYRPALRGPVLRKRPRSHERSWVLRYPAAIILMVFGVEGSAVIGVASGARAVLKLLLPVCS
jgi:hypothetical protein